MFQDRSSLALAACAAALLVTLAGGACAPMEPPLSFKVPDEPDLAPPSPPPPPAPGDGDIADIVASQLPLASKGVTWDDTSGNRLDAGWLLQTPGHFGKKYEELAHYPPCLTEGCDDLGLVVCKRDSDCLIGKCTAVAATMRNPGETPGLRCTGHSEFLYDEMYKVMISGEQLVDVTSLSPPDGAFLAAMNHALTYLYTSGKKLTVRFLFGTYPYTGGFVDSLKVLKALSSSLPDVAPGADVSVQVGYFRSSLFSWNHSKIVVADGRTAIVGGHNLYDAHYLHDEPVHDLSMRVSGPAAGAAQAFASRLWRYVCNYGSLTLTCATGSMCVDSYDHAVVDRRCLPGRPPQLSSPAVGNVRVLGLGRVGAIDTEDHPSDEAILALMRQARSTIRISQQDLGPYSNFGINTWPVAFFDEVGAAVLRGVDVYIVLTNDGAKAGGVDYSYGWSLFDAAVRLSEHLQAVKPGGLYGRPLTELLCRKVHLASLRFSDEDTFPSGTPYGNHAKLVLTDEQAFYMGSQNLYRASLAEFGFLVDDHAAALHLLDAYYRPLWQHSQRTAVTGSEARECVLDPQME